MDKKKDVIAVAGSTGQQGGAVARELLKAGYKVRALTRKPESPAALELKKLGAEIYKADFDDAASLEKALTGVWGAFAVQNTWEAGVEKEEAQGKAFAIAAKKAGVQTYVYTSVANAQSKTGIPHFENKWRVEQTVREQGFPYYVILRPVFFIDNWFSAWFKPAFDKGTVAIGMKAGTKLQQIAVEDIGKYGAKAFQEYVAWNKAEIDLAGDEKTGAETAAIFSKTYGKKYEFYQIPIAEIRKMSEDYALMLEWFESTGYNVNIPALQKKYGITPTTLEQWAAKQKITVNA